MPPAGRKQTMSTETKCECRHCGGHIKFDVENFQPGTVVECPHCGQKTALVLPFLLAHATHLRIGVYVILFIVAAISIQTHFKALNEALDKTAEENAKAWGADGFKAHLDVMMQGAKATAELNARLKNLTNADTTP